MNAVITINILVASIMLVITIIRSCQLGSLTLWQMKIAISLTQGGGMWLKGIEKTQRGFGLGLNTPINFLFNSIPGIPATILLYGIIILVLYGFGISENNPGYLFFKQNNFFWFIVTIVFLVISSIKLTGSNSIPELHTARLEVRGRGIVKSKQGEITEFQMVKETEDLRTPWFATISETVIPLRQLRVETGKQKVVSGDRISFMFEFISQSKSVKSGVTFGVLEEKSKTIEQIVRENLTSTITDLFQNLDPMSLISMTSEEMYVILYSKENPGKWRDRKVTSFFEAGTKKLVSEPDDFVERILWKFIFQKQQLINLRFSAGMKKKVENLPPGKGLAEPLWPKGPKTLAEFEHQEEVAYERLEEEFAKFRQAILSVLGKLLKRDIPLGMFTSVLNQISLTFADSAAQQAFEAEELQKYQILAQDLKIEWLKERLKELKKALPKLSEKERVDLIQVTMKEVTKTIQDHNWNTNGSSNPTGPIPVENVGR